MNKNEQIKLKKKENVKFVSENLDKTNKELSEILGVSRSSISNYRKEAMALEAENELKENIDLEPATSDEISEEDNESSSLYTYEFGINFINEDVLLEYLENYETLDEDIKQEISLIDFDSIILSKENEDKIKELAEDLSLIL